MVFSSSSPVVPKKVLTSARALLTTALESGTDDNTSFAESNRSSRASPEAPVPLMMFCRISSAA